LDSEAAFDLVENLLIDRLSGDIREISGGPSRTEKNDSRQMLGWIVPEQIANAPKSSLGEGICPGLCLLVPRRGVNLGGDSPKAGSFDGTVRHSDVLLQLQLQQTTRVQFTLGDDRGEASEDFENASLGTFREVAAPQIRGGDEIEAADTAAREPPRSTSGAMDAEEHGSARQSNVRETPEIIRRRRERAQKVL
jgi:hypothetical protein